MAFYKYVLKSEHVLQFRQCIMPKRMFLLLKAFKAELKIQIRSE